MKTGSLNYKIIGMAVLFGICFTSSVYAKQIGQKVPLEQMEYSTIAPDTEMDVATPAAQLSDKEKAQLREGLMNLREKIAAQFDPNPSSPNSLPQVKMPKETVIETASEAPSSFVFSRNAQNPFAKTSGIGSTLAEPAAASEGRDIFYTGNTYASFSTDGGVNWTRVTIPAGPTDAPFDCCDHDVVYDKARGLTIWSVMYLNSSRNNGVIRIFVRQNVAGTVAPTCSYTIDPSATSNVLPDYPHLGLSNKWLYLTTNELANGTSWQGAKVRRLDLDQMATCTTATTQSFTFNDTSIGQRVLVPVEGATTTMYLGLLKTSSLFRVYSWHEAVSTPSFVERTITASNFVNPDCRGGTNNTDWIDRSTAWSIAGFRMRGAVGGGEIRFYWNSGPVGTATQAHVRSAVFRESDRILLDQPHIFSTGFCFGYPALSVNERGDFGLVIGAGGKAGGGGFAVRSFAAIDDLFTTGRSFGTVFAFAAATHNPADARFGDYFTVRRQQPCGLYFAGTGYGLNGGTSVTNVDARYVEFGRGSLQKCSDGWRDESRLQ